METADVLPGAGIDPEDIGYAPGAPVAAPPDYSGPTTSEPFLPNPVQPQPAVAPPSAGGPLPPEWWIPKTAQAQQPAWSATPFVQGVFEKGLAGTKEGSAAITQALRLEGILGFDADRKAGVPVAEAMAKWAPKMYADHPSVAASLSKPVLPPFQPNIVDVGGGQKAFQHGRGQFTLIPKDYSEAGPIKGEEAIGPDGQPIHGTVFVRTPKGALHAVRTGDNEPSVSAIGGAVKRELDDVNAQLLNVGDGPNDLKEGSQEFKDLQQRQKELRSNLRAVTQKAVGGRSGQHPAGPIPTVTTKEQFDELPSGSIYISKDGRKHRKP